ncbi:phosphofurin acidic cluster sorting protein 2-like [Corticium candelabrum]|uniref:phosphofurin acidic cluster sorting protein 2-like n=1 Tax=Corticium candelabrum TaxID=121492 RepID=UPI002E25B802|nr:phosphofurin acidic cluster sorting protein 2-like [Corticium candelabrum]
MDSPDDDGSIVPVPMKFLSTWEIERTSPECVPRWCRLKLIGLEIVCPDDLNLNGVIIAVSMKNMRRTLRSTDLALITGGKTSVALDLTFSLQYPHYLKRNGNCLQIMLQRRNRYKNKSMPGFKTLAIGHVYMDQVLQHSLSGPMPLVGKAKGGQKTVANVEVELIDSEPVTVTREPSAAHEPAAAAATYESSPEDMACDDDEYFDQDYPPVASDGSDSDDQVMEPVSSGRRTRMKMKKLMQVVAKKGNLRKLFASLKKVKIDDEEEVPNMSFLDESHVVEDFTQDSDDDSEGQDILESFSSGSTPKPSLRPFFPQHCASLTNLLETGTTQTAGSRQQEQAVNEDSSHGLRTSSDLNPSDSQQAVDEEAGESETRVSSQIAAVLSTDPLPSNLLVIDKASVQEKKLSRLLKGLNGISVFLTRRPSEAKDAISTALLRLYNISHRSSIPYCVKIGLAGDDQFYYHVLQAFVETAVKKTVNWPELVRFIPIHLGLSRITSFMLASDPVYRSLFADQVWTDFLDSACTADGAPDVSKKIVKLFQAASTLHCVTVAQALLQCKSSEHESSQTMVPFISDLQLGLTELLKQNDVEVPEELGSMSSCQSAEGLPTESVSSPASSVPPLTSNPSHHSVDYIDLQVDYWSSNAVSKKDAGKVTLKGPYRSLGVFVNTEESLSGLMNMIIVPREKHKKGIRIGRKSRGDSIVASVSKLVCSSSKGPLHKVIIDGTEWTDVKFFSVSPAWSKSIQFPLGMCSPSFSSHRPVETQC